MSPAGPALLLLVFPIGCLAVDALVFNAGASALMALVGKWFTFWAVGVRLFVAGLAQLARPQTTARAVFGAKGGPANAIVREVGCANLAFGALGIASLAMSSWIVPAALAGGLYYGLTGVGRVIRGPGSDGGQIVLAMELFVCAVLGLFVANRLL
jgi:hypothetical protein